MDRWQDFAHRTWEKIAHFLTRRAGAVLVVCLLVSIVLAVGASRLDFATDQDSYLDPDSEVAQDNREYQELFGGEAVLTVFSVPEGSSILDMLTADNIEALDQMQAELAATEGVRGAITPLSALRWTDALVTAPEGEAPTASPAGQILSGAIAREAESSAERDLRTADSLTTLQRVGGIEDRSLENPEWAEFLLIDNRDEIRAALRPFFPVGPGEESTAANAQQALMVTRLEGNQSIAEQADAATRAEEIIEGTELEGVEVLTTGSPFLLRDVNDYLQGGMLVLGGIAVLVMTVVLAVAFRVRWRLLSLLVMLAGVLWAFGLLGYFGFSLSLVTIAGLPILIGLGVDFAIQIHNRVEEEIVLDRTPHPLVEALGNVGPALLVATVAAALATLALMASKVPMIQEFGILLAVGIVMLFIAAVVIPTPLLSIREKRRATTVHHEQPVVQGLMRWLGRLPKMLVIPLVPVAIVLFGLGLWADQDTPVETDVEKWVDQSSQVIEDLDQLRASTNTSTELNVFVRTDDVFTDEVGEFVTDLGTAELSAYPDTLVTASGLPMTVFYLMNFPGVTQLPPTGDDLQTAFEVAPPEIQDALVAADGTSANLSFRVGQSPLEQRKIIVDDIREEVAPGGSISPPPDTTATPAGLGVVGVALLENLTSNRLLLTWLALAAVSLWLLIRFFSVVKTLLSLIPVLLAVGLSNLVVWGLDITVSPLTTVSGPLVIAVCVEFTSLLLFRHLEERRRGLSPEEAIAVATARTGRAFFASALTTLGGFLVLLFSPLPLLADFGMIVALTVLIALLSAVTVLPPFLRWVDDHGWLRLGARAQPIDETVPVPVRAARPTPD
jgi:hydrophobe/amphiphile efflux-3 (HAE3) family protein